ncbi:MAG: ATP-binding cassette domain-containing protein [Bacteroidales bacterium]|jgi:zinc transport system ATP-binding protein|nr:ATP-binding cassette domain-containing protein [Bacteroidales bacterium]
MGKIFELIDISATYGEGIILKDVNLTINSNDFIGIIGPNGGGKTTLVKLMVGLLKPVKGRIIMHKASGRDTKNQIGYLPQISLFDKRFPISVIDVVLSGLASEKAVFKKYTKADKDKAIELLARMGISDLYSRPIGELSGGQMQRVFLCRAIITSPSLLILDEPNTFVDSKFEADLYDILLELNKTMAIIVVTHDIGTISYYVKTIACVNKYLNYHPSNIITEKQLAAYGCPIQIITHGDIPHTVLKKHDH